MTFLVQIVLALLLLIVGGTGGYTYAARHGAATLGTVQADLAVCTSAATAKAAALAAIEQHLADQRARHDAMLRDAEAALAGRDAAIESLQAEAAALRSAITGAARNADCADLARLPVCAAVDRRLWPAAAAVDGRDAARGD